jgi:hypothetical protein
MVRDKRRTVEVRVQDTNPPPPPELARLMERLRRATDPRERQQAWDDIVNYQRQHGVRAQPRESDPPQV